MSKLIKRLLITSFLFIIIFQVNSQDISGEIIQVSAESLTVLKFNSKVTNFIFDDNVNYSAQVRPNDNSLVIRVIGDHPDTTNLYVTEGKRGHRFVITFLKTIDLNSTKLYYDYSDLKNLKKIVAQEQQDQANALAAGAKDTTSATKPAPPSQDTKAQQARLDSMLAKATADSIIAKNAEDARIAKAADDAKKQKAAEDARIAQARADSILAVQVAIAKRAQFVSDSIAAKNAEDARIAKAAEDAKKQKEIDDARLQQAQIDSANARKAREAIIIQARLDSINAKKAEDARIAEAAAEAKKQKAVADAKITQAKTDSINAKNAADAVLAKQRLDSIRAKKAEDARIAKAIEDAKKQQAIEDARIAKARTDSIIAKNAADARLAKARLDSIRAKKLEDARIAQAQADSIKAEKIRQAKIAQAIADSIQAKKIADEKLAKEAELARQKEIARLAAIEKKRIADSIAALPKIYTHAELWKKYPTINFDGPPPGQSLAADYFLEDDTAENSRVSNLILNKMVADDTLPVPLASDTDQNTSFLLKSIDFSGVNCYLQITITNHSKDDYLVGPVNLKWYPKDDSLGTVYPLYPCYLTTFPVLSPGLEKTIVLATRAVNPKDADQFILTLGDRLGVRTLELSIPGALYNQQLAITRIVK